MEGLPVILEELKKSLLPGVFSTNRRRNTSDMASLARQIDDSPIEQQDRFVPLLNRLFPRLHGRAKNFLHQQVG